MKIRIKGNSVRFRLTRTEVETFCKMGVYSQKTQFIDSVFTYVLQVKSSINNLEASFNNNTITIYMPEENKNVWADSDIVGYQNIMELPNGDQLGLLVEKDFTCLDETIEDQSDNYPNPLASK